ncbi:ABC transporter substrate-binding protein [Paenibacillus algorifonticola]|uniref:ABC transporter substrate-binding protein n=1 Tax=Paenibacillus algorifonticola TaxID=684063 RepID=UPI003D2D4D65
MRFTNKGLMIAATIVMMGICLMACGGTKQEESTAASQAPAADPSAATGAETGGKAASNEERTLKDAAGHEVKVPGNPQRVLALFLEDPMMALGTKPVAQWGIGKEPQQYLQSWLQDTPVLDLTNGLTPELALGYDPDLIVFTSESWIKNGTYEDYAKIAPTFILSSDDQSWRDNLIALGDVLNNPSAVQEALSKYDQKLGEAKAQLAADFQGKTAAILLPQGDKSFKLFSGSFYSAGLLYGELGFKQPQIATDEDFGDYSIEKLGEMGDVDYIFVLSGEGRPKTPTDNVLWKSLPAFKAGHIFEVDSGHWFNSNAVANQLIIDDVLKSLIK